MTVLECVCDTVDKWKMMKCKMENDLNETSDINSKTKDINSKPKNIPVVQNTVERVQSINDDILTRMAIDEICRESVKGSIRAEKVGPSGWLPCPLRKTNKRFLRNTLKSVIIHNRDRTTKPKKSEKELDDIIKGGQRRQPKFGDRKHCFRIPPNISGIEKCTIKKEMKN